jgi:hypothetical protein
MLLAIVHRVCGASPSIFHWWLGGLIQGLAPFGSGLSFLAFLQECWFRSLSASFLLLLCVQSVSAPMDSSGPNWIIEWQRYSEEESKSWKLVSHRRSSPVSFADIVRKPALSGANLVPLGRLGRPRHSSLRLKQWHSVFDRISFPLRPAIDQGYDVRSQFQKYSNYNIGRVASSGFRPSLRTSRVLPWAPRKLIWQPKKILEQCPGNFGQDSVPRLNGSADPAATGHRHIWDLSLSGKNSQIFGLSGQKCKRPFGSFPNKFEKASWVYPPRLWFRPPLLSLTGGPPSLPFFNNFGEFTQAVLSSSNSSHSTELALFTKPHYAPLPWKNLSTSSSPLSVVLPPPSRFASLRSAEKMAFRKVDPAPFLPHGFVAQQVDHREIMVRIVTRPQPSAHEDWGIVLVQPLPEHEVKFHIFDDIIREYLVGVRCVQVRSIQRSHLGQALVRFRFAFDRDNLVALGRQQALVFLLLSFDTMRAGISVP